MHVIRADQTSAVLRVNNVGVFALLGPDVGRFVQSFEVANMVRTQLTHLSRAALRLNEGDDVRHESESGGGFFPLDGHTISGFSA